MKQAAMVWGLTNSEKGTHAELRDVATGAVLHRVSYWPNSRPSTESASDALSFQARQLGYTLVLVDEDGTVLEAE